MCLFNSRTVGKLVGLKTNKMNWLLGPRTVLLSFTRTSLYYLCSGFVGGSCSVVWAFVLVLSWRRYRCNRVSPLDFLWSRISTFCFADSGITYCSKDLKVLL